MTDQSVNCWVTSPPYWGLRDYGVEGQLGLEKTPEEYVAKMVGIFREARRVLRDDGTLWLNLGTSYARDVRKGQHKPGDSGKADYIIKNGNGRAASGFCFDDKNPNQSPLLQRVPSCGNGGKESQDSQDADRACCDCGDGHRDDYLSHHACTVRNDQCASQDERQTSQTTHGIEHSDCDQEPRHSLLLDVQQSTIEKSFSQPPGVSYREGLVSAYRQEDQTLNACVQESSCRKVCTSGTSQMLPPLVVRTVGKESFFSACGRSDCLGIGKCGLCWVNLSIPSLNVKAKDELNIPHLVAMALQSDGWILRQTIIWSKPNPMPESVKDRCTKSHEYLFLLSKSERYYFDQDVIKEPANIKNFRDCATRRRDTPPGTRTDSGFENGRYYMNRNKRSVWTIPTKPFPQAHFATFPPALVEPCILAGCPKGGIVGDMFAGSGTTGEVALKHFRRFVGIELSPTYANEIAIPRIEAEAVRPKQLTII